MPQLQTEERRRVQAQQILANYKEARPRTYGRTWTPDQERLFLPCPPLRIGCLVAPLPGEGWRLAGEHGDEVVLS